MQRVRKIVLWAVLAFIVYAIFSSPGQAADIVRSAWSIIVEAIQRIGSFFDALLNKK